MNATNIIDGLIFYMPIDIYWSLDSLTDFESILVAEQPAIDIIPSL
jgi:hypothetical protein